MDGDIVALLRKYQPYSKLHGQAADEIERLRAILAKIVDIYTTPGRHPEYHEYVKNGLKKEWPSLAHALDEATPTFNKSN